MKARNDRLYCHSLCVPSAMTIFIVITTSRNDYENKKGLSKLIDNPFLIFIFQEVYRFPKCNPIVISAPNE